MSTGRFEHHIPVLLDPVLRCAAPHDGQVWVDCTLGFGGHTEALLVEGAMVVGIDQDADTLQHTKQKLRQHAEKLTCVHGNFRDLAEHLETLGYETIDGIFADLGVSSKQLDEGARGFSFTKSGPIDMRMSAQGETAEELIERLDTRQLARIIRTYGEERFAMPIARAIHRWFEASVTRTTTELAAVIKDAIPSKVRHARNHHPATKTFQALRIEVNDELGALEALLEMAPAYLNAGGRLLIISFHSLEDRIVKKTFQRWSGDGPPQRASAIPLPTTRPSLGRRINTKPIIATAEEVSDNPRARSAKLRAFEFTRVAA